MRSFFAAMLVIAIGGFVATVGSAPAQAAAAAPFALPQFSVDPADTLITKVHRRGRHWRIRRHWRRHLRRSWRWHVRRSWRHRYVRKRHRSRVYWAGPRYYRRRHRCYYSWRWDAWVCPRRYRYRYW